ncbi:DUF2326 domain-containing protein [uncultured Clostridium sp.]|uniref:DUF2326 domain-containing protein n=1 Tax=uncultured Clostridium sp. TaxID=59620 RepID=UPI0025FF2BEB|nr:DUF2326 domain-containing protein [uncultured Clostridium sp.]
MKLMQLYSNDERFKTVKFTTGFNVILGKITDENNLNKDCHNLGKTTLVDLIDFLLLKELKKGHFLKNPVFKNHVFFLELKLNSGKYLTIKRGIKNNTRISFKFSEIPYCNYTTELDWDYINLPLTSNDPEKNPKILLNNFLEFDVLPNYSYRNYLNYFLRVQKDYLDEFHLSKFSGSDADWKPLLFELIGFNSDLILKKYKLDSEYENKKNSIQKLEDTLEINPNQIDKVKGLIQIKEDEKKEVEKALNKFNFYINEQNINKELVEKIENSISELNTKRYSLEVDINNLRDSIEKGINFNLDATLKIFNEVKIYFSDQLKKSYQQLIDFNKSLTNDRNKYIVESIDLKQNELANIEKSLLNLNKKREELLGYLTETDTFKKYKIFESKLIEIERTLEKYNSKLENEKIIRDENEQLQNISDQIEDIKKSIQNEVNSENSFYSTIRRSFSENVKFILNKPGLLSISENSVGNIEFKSEILDSDNTHTAQSRGFSYKKILCACFDLAILTSYSKKSFCKFVYHDGCLETLDPRKQKNYLDLITRLCSQYDVQYILTLIESDLPTLSGEKYKLPSSCNIAVELSDESESSNLFGFSF